MSRNNIYLAACFVLSCALSLCVSRTIDRSYHRKSIDNLHRLLRSDTLYEYWFVDTVTVSLDDLDENTFHHMDIRSRLRDSVDIRKWDIAYGSIKWIWPYVGTVKSYHGIVLDPDGETIVEIQQYPFKYGVPYKPLSDEDFALLVKDGQEVMKRSIDTGMPWARDRADMSMVSVLSAVDNRYYTLYSSDTTACRRENVESFRRIGFSAVGFVWDSRVYYRSDYLGFYRIGRKEKCFARIFDFIAVFAAAFSILLLFKHFLR